MSQKHSKLNILHDLLSVSYGHRNKVYLSNRATDNLSFTQRLALVNRVDVHNGCVNTICWNDTGQYILSGSDDQQLVVFNPFSGKVETSFHSAHRANIFSAKFLPNSQDRQIVSCSADGLIYYCDFDHPELFSSNGFDCHLGAVYEVLTVPNDPYTFLSCGEDGTVRWFDLRTKTKCIKANCEDDIMINTRQAVMSLAINPMMPYQLAIGCADSTVRVYDRRQLATGIIGSDPSRASAMLHFFSAPPITRRSHRITSLVYSRDGEEILVSYSSEHLYLFNFRDKEGENNVPLMKSFKGSEEVRRTSVNDESSCASASTSTSSARDASSCGEYVFRPANLKQPPVKRLRLRGDWSDTGPNARPERERDRTPQYENASSIMQRMSNMLTRLLEGRLGQDSNASTPEQPSSEAPPSDDQLERTGFDSGESTAGVDGDIATAASSLSGSDASSLTNFVSFSVSERDESGDDSKESFEMSEDRSSSIKSGDASKESFEMSEDRSSSIKSGDASKESFEMSEDRSSSIKSGDASKESCEMSEDRSSSIKSGDASKESFEMSEDRSSSIKSGDASKESFEMSEDRSFSIKSVDASKESFEISEDQSFSIKAVKDKSQDKDKSQEGSSMQNSWVASAGRSEDSNPVKGSRDKEIVNQDGRSSLFSGDQIPTGTVMMDAASPASINADILNDVAVRDDPEAMLDSKESCDSSQVSGADVVAGTELTASDDLNQYGRADLLCPDVLQVSDDNQVDCEMKSPLDSADNILREEDKSSQGIAESALESSPENVGDTAGGRDPLEAVADYHRPPANAGLDSEDRVLRLGEKVKSLADCFADVLVTEQRSDFQGGHPDLESKDSVTNQQSKGLVTSLSDAAVQNSQESMTESSQSARSSSNAQVSSVNSNPSNCRDDLNKQPLESCEGRDEQLGRSSERPSDLPETSDSELPEDDSDSEEAYTSPASRRAWLKQRLEEKNAAASKLQAVFRKRLEQKKSRSQDAGLSLPKPVMKQCYVGHRNSRTMIKEATFWGNHFVMSGSDCGHIFVWDRHSAKLVMLLEGDRHVVNCLQPHPYDPILASSGIDYDVKIWMPANESPGFDEPRAAELMRRNEIMLEETRDTVTVPASFMLRMLLSLNHARRSNRSEGRGREGSGSQGSSESSRDD